MKAVILNADDFGASERTNEAVMRAHREGVLTSASLMVNEPAAESAAQMAKDSPGLGVGLHLALSNGFSALPYDAIPALAGRNGRFRESPAHAGIAMFFRTAARRQAVCEIRAQFERFAATGLAFDHVNGHQHLHLHPVVWDTLLELCEAYAVRRVRIPHEPFLPWSPGDIARRRLEWLFFRALRRRCLRSAAGKGFWFPVTVYGHLETGCMTEAYLLDLLDRLEGDSAEIYFHPGAAHVTPVPDLPDGLDAELLALTSARVRDCMDRQGLKRTTYRELAGA